MTKVDGFLSGPAPATGPCMVGNHAFSLFADAWVKGIRNFDGAKASDVMVNDANHQSQKDSNLIGRDGAGFYDKLGYVPCPNLKEATEEMLEYVMCNTYSGKVHQRPVGLALSRPTLTWYECRFRDMLRSNAQLRRMPPIRRRIT